MHEPKSRSRDGSASEFEVLLLELRNFFAGIGSFEEINQLLEYQHSLPPTLGWNAKDHVAMRFY